MSNAILVSPSKPCNVARLIADLEALAIQGVRTYSVIGDGSNVTGVYAWRDDVPEGEYHHAELSTADEDLVHSAIEAHEAVTLAEHKAMKLAELDQACDATIEAGFSSSALGAPHSYKFRQYDQLALTGMHTALLADPSMLEVSWLTTDAGFLVHTRDEFFTLGRDALEHKRSNIEKFYYLRSLVEAATTKAEVDAITWS